MLSLIHNKLKEFFEEFCVSDDAIGAWVFFSWVTISFISWFVFAKFGYYLLFGFLHLWLFPKIIGEVVSRLAMDFAERDRRGWFVAGSFFISIIFCLIFVGIANLGLYGRIFIHEGQAGYSLRGINLFKEYINFFSFFDLGWRLDVFSSAIYFKSVLWTGLGALPGFYTLFGIWNGEEKIRQKEIQVREDAEAENLVIIKEEEKRQERLEYQMRMANEAEIRRQKQLAKDKKRAEKIARIKRKKDLENGDIFDSGFLD